MIQLDKEKKKVKPTFYYAIFLVDTKNMGIWRWLNDCLYTMYVNK